MYNKQYFLMSLGEMSNRCKFPLTDGFDAYCDSKNSTFLAR